ncbi:MAG: exodeoxyribonuclease VII small subunit [Bacteroidetes bacterium]|jgi:exodeoxyribonuclease VII small subunit|nr:exodeoxyribonuclease VII small subunit [Bacteroidota bacterium]
MTTKDTFSYEAAKKRLDVIMKDLESGKISIDDLETTLNEAKDLIQKSLKKLTETEKIIKNWEA